MAAIRDSVGDVPTPEILNLAWTFLEQEWQTLRKCCEINASKSQGRDTWEEAMSYLAIRIPSYVLNWDPEGGRSLKSHVIGCARLDLFKEFVARRRKRESRESSVDELIYDSAPDEIDIVANHDNNEEAQYVLNAIGKTFSTLLVMHFASGMTFDQMAELLGCSKSMAYRMTQKALADAQEWAEWLENE